MGMTNEEREKEIRKQPAPTKEECIAFYKELTKLADVRFVPYYKMAIKALEQQPCEDWYDVPSDEMTLEQARQAVKDLRKKLAEYLEQQTSEDCISRDAVKEMLSEEWTKYMPMDLDINLSFVMGKINELPSVTPKISCESCREQVLKHLEKEDWADTVNCVMNMPFINKPCVSEGVCRENKMQVLDKIRDEIEALYDSIDTVSHNEYENAYEQGKERAYEFVLDIIDKYKAESEVNNYD